MSHSRDSADRRPVELAAAEDKLARLTLRIESLQSVLVRLLQSVVNAEDRVERSRVAHIVEANDELVVAALTSRAEAEAAVLALKSAASAATLDGLTGLPTRSTLVDRFDQAAARAKRHGQHLALLFVDLDNFKPLNDQYGHPFGDAVLRQVSERLVSAVREVDTVSRYGGDEFLILLTDVKAPGDARRVAEKLIEALGAPMELLGRLVRTTASIGICLYPDDGEDLDLLVARADAAMYQTKRQGAGGIAFHSTGATCDAAPTEPAPHGAAQVVALERLLEQSREANERLVLSALTAQELQAAAEHALQQQSAFLAAVTDELHDPLAPIRIASTMLGLSPDVEPLLPRVRAIVSKQQAELARLVGTPIAAAAGAARHLAIEQRRVDLAGVIDRTVAACQPMMARHGQHFELRRPPGVLEVQGDAAQLQWAIGNLLDNASRHTHEGGRISLSVDLHAEPGAVSVTIADDGIGITPELLPLVFDAFVQDPQAFGLDGVGLGIGLTAARILVRAHGGNLIAHSAGAGRGSQFVLTLPLAPGRVAAAVLSPGGDGPAAGP